MRSEDRIRRLEAELQQLPKGSVSRKTINGKERLYLQGTENGRRFCRYVKQSEIADVLSAVARREALRQQIAQLMKAAPSSSEAAEYETHVITGTALQAATDTKSFDDTSTTKPKVASACSAACGAPEKPSSHCRLLLTCRRTQPPTSR